VGKETDFEKDFLSLDGENQLILLKKYPEKFSFLQLLIIYGGVSADNHTLKRNIEDILKSFPIWTLYKHIENLENLSRNGETISQKKLAEKLLEMIRDEGKEIEKIKAKRFEKKYFS